MEKSKIIWSSQIDAENILIKFNIDLYFFKVLFFKTSILFFKVCVSLKAVSTYVYADMCMYKQEHRTTANIILNATSFPFEVQNKARCPPSPVLVNIACSITVRQGKRRGLRMKKETGLYLLCYNMYVGEPKIHAWLDLIRKWHLLMCLGTLKPG